MKDREARKAIKESFDALAEFLGLEYLDNIHKFIAKQPRAGFQLHHARIVALENKFAKAEEAARPTCKTCGQKIQDGFRDGDIETLAAGVRKADKRGK